MEITTMSAISATKPFQINIPLLHSYVSVFNSKPHVRTSYNYKLNSAGSLSSIRKFTPAIIRSVTDETQVSVSEPEVAVVDLSLLIKKKALDIAPELKGTSVFLVGMNNPVKTNLGKSLADALRYYYFDSDSLVYEAAGGESAAKAYMEADAKGYQECETEVLKQLSSMGRLVVSVGDGGVRSSTNLALLRHGISIWINVPLDIVAKGVIENQSQLTSSELSSTESYSEVFAKLSTIYKECSNGYAIADATISLQNVACQLDYESLDEVTTDDLAVEVLKEIEKLTRVKKMMQEASRPY